MLEALSLEARTQGKDRRRKLSPRLSLSLSLSLSVPRLLFSPAQPAFSLAPLITLPFYNAPLCSSTAELCIFLDAMDFPKAFRCYARASPLSRRLWPCQTCSAISRERGRTEREREPKLLPFRPKSRRKYIASGFTACCRRRQQNGDTSLLT
jgi:hypothetical protein